jgi:transcriptional repressor NrdR
MKCPKCGNLDNKVLDTRMQPEGDIIRRRRECLKCEYRFTTQETLLRVFPLVAKKDNRKEAFSKLKILTGIQAACQKRPISLAMMEQMVERIVKRVLENPQKEITSDELGRLVMAELKTTDDVAFVRFASVYRNFQDIKEFIDTLKKDEKTAKTPQHPSSNLEITQ